LEEKTDEHVAARNFVEGVLMGKKRDCGGSLTGKCQRPPLHRGRAPQWKKGRERTGRICHQFSQGTEHRGEGGDLEGGGKSLRVGIMKGSGRARENAGRSAMLTKKCEKAYWRMGGPGRGAAIKTKGKESRPNKFRLGSSRRISRVRSG